MTDREREARIRERLDRYRVEIDLLHLLDGRDGPMERLLAHDAAQRAEIERYREALEEIADAEPDFGMRDRAWNFIGDLRDRAHRALNEGEDDG